MDTVVNKAYLGKYTFWWCIFQVTQIHQWFSMTFP